MLQSASQDNKNMMNGAKITTIKYLLKQRSIKISITK